MEEYTTFCDDELKEKGYAIKTAEREIGDLSATIEDSKATIVEKEDEISTLGTEIAGKEGELHKATEARTSSNEEFVAAEKELVKSVDECSRAYAALEKGMSLMQTNRRQEAKKELDAVKLALSSIIASVSIDTESSRKLKSFLQQGSADNDDLSLHLAQPQAKMVAYESKSGGILQTIKDMQTKAEGELSDLRKKEMTDTHDFKMIESGLNAEISHDNEKLAAAKSTKSATEEALAAAESDLA